MKIGTAVFREAIKAIEPNRVGEEYAVEAVNCDLRTGAIVPMRGTSSLMSAPSGTERIHLWHDKVACFTQSDVSVLPHQNSDNLVWAGTDYGTHPRQATISQFFDGASISLPAASDRFGVDAPAAAPAVVVNGTAAPDADLIRSTSYRFSAVAATGEESDLSLPSAVVDVYVGQEAEITSFWTGQVPAGVSKIRVYRAEPDQYGTGTWAFVAELHAGSASWVDTVDETQEVAETDGHLPPVDFEGLADLGNGIVVGWSGRDVFLSEVGFPAAFPVKYKKRTNADVLGVGVVGGFGIILTSGRPYLLAATTPEAATFTELQFTAPCLSSRSICSTNLGVIFASTDGLMQISSGGVATLLTEGILSREQWAAMSPAEMICVVHDEKVYGWRYGTAEGWMLDPKKQGIVDIFMPVNISDAHVPADGDRLIILDGQDHVGDLGDGNALTFRWKSPLWMFAAATALSVAWVKGDHSQTSPATLKVWRDGSLVYTKTGIVNERPFMLPAGLCLTAQFEISGTAKVTAVYLASDVGELSR